MQYALFGNSGMKVSRLSLGAMGFGKPNLGADESARLLDEAIDKGVNLVDTADSYGTSEEVLGQIISPEKREKLFIATKVFRRLSRDGRVGRNCRTNIINALERSLRLMKTDYVDLYQLHHPDDDTPLDETLSALDNLVKQGKVRYVGVSNHYAWQMAWMLGESKARGLEPIVSLQASYSIIERQVEQESLPFCQKFNIALMCYGPLCGGILTGKYQGLESIPEDSRAIWNKKTQSILAEKTVQAIVSELATIASDLGLGMNQLATLWLMSKPQATTILLGGTRPEHFTPLLDVADQTLPEETVKRIGEISQSRIYGSFSNQPFRSAPGRTRT